MQVYFSMFLLSDSPVGIGKKESMEKFKRLMDFATLKLLPSVGTMLLMEKYLRVSSLMNALSDKEEKNISINFSKQQKHKGTSSLFQI